MKRILVPTDFSNYAAYALEAAAALAKRQQTELVIVHMLGLSEAIISRNEDQLAESGLFHTKLAEKRFATFLDQPFLKDIPLRTVVENYTHFRELGALAKKFDAGLIVMGSQGSSGWKEVLVGSNTEKVVRTSEVPVLVIKGPSPNFNVDKAVFVCDFKEENLLAYRNAMKFFNTIHTELKLLYVHLPGASFKSTHEIEDRIVSFLTKSKLNDAHHINHLAFINAYTVADGVFHYSQKVGADLIAMPTHGRQGLSHFFSGSIGESVANHSQLPVITFRI